MSEAPAWPGAAKDPIMRGNRELPARAPCNPAEQASKASDAAPLPAQP